MTIFDTGMPFQVEEWSADGGKMQRTLAYCLRHDLAMAVFDTMMAEKVSQSRVLMIRTRARVVRQTEQKGTST